MLLMGFDGHLVEKLGTTPKLNLTESSFFDISTSSGFLAVLE